MQEEPSIEVQEMMNWAKEQGIMWPKLKYPARFEPGYLGSIALEDIFPGEKIIWAPNKALFTSKLAYESELKPVFDRFPDLFSKPMIAMTTFIIWEKHKGTNSKWYIFLTGQPKENNILQDWTSEELAELQDSRLVNDSELRKQYHTFGYTYWKVCLEQVGMFTEEMLRIEEYTWAFRLIATRSFGKFMPYITMIPVAEFLNHNNVSTYYSYQYPESSPDAHLRYSGTINDIDHDDELITLDPVEAFTWSKLVDFTKHYFKHSQIELQFDILNSWAVQLDESESQEAQKKQMVRPETMDLQESDDKIACICVGDDEKYNKGDQIFMTYGRYSNRQLLVSYGFVLQDNKYNYATVYFDVSEFAKNLHLKNVYIKGNVKTQFKIKEGQLAFKLIMALRVLLWRPEFGIESCLNARNGQLEVLVLGHAKSIIMEELAGFKTSYEEDIKILEEYGTVRRYFAVLYRLQIKKILQDQIKILDGLIKWIRGSEKSLDPKFTSHYSSIIK